METDDEISDWDDDESLEDSDSEQFVQKAPAEARFQASR